MKDENLSYLLKEKENTKNVSYSDLINIVDYLEKNIEPNMDDFVAYEVHYHTNYIKPQLEKIVEYYGLSKRKKKKDDLVQDIIIFEMEPNNIEVVYRRKKLWAYMKEIKEDSFLSKFLIFN